MVHFPVRKLLAYQRVLEVKPQTVSSANPAENGRKKKVSQNGNTTYRMGPPSYVCWLRKPHLNIIICVSYTNLLL